LEDDLRPVMAARLPHAARRVPRSLGHKVPAQPQKPAATARNAPPAAAAFPTGAKGAGIALDKPRCRRIHLPRRKTPEGRVRRPPPSRFASPERPLGRAVSAFPEARLPKLNEPPTPPGACMTQPGTTVGKQSARRRSPRSKGAPKVVPEKRQTKCKAIADSLAEAGAACSPSSASTPSGGKRHPSRTPPSA